MRVLQLNVTEDAIKFSTLQFSAKRYSQTLVNIVIDAQINE